MTECQHVALIAVLTDQRHLSVFVALSALGNVMAVTFAQARVNQELAKEGVVPFGRFWASNWPFGSPSGGLLLHFIPSFIILVAIPFGKYKYLPCMSCYSQVINAWCYLADLFAREQATLTILYSTSKDTLTQSSTSSSSSGF